MKDDNVVVGAPGASLRQKANGRAGSGPQKPKALEPMTHTHGLSTMIKPWGYDSLGFNPRSKKDSIKGDAQGAVTERGASLAKHQCLAVNLITLLTRVMNFHDPSGESLTDIAPLPTPEALFKQEDASILSLLEDQYKHLYDAYIQTERARTLPALSILFGAAETLPCVRKRSLRTMYNNIRTDNPNFPEYDMGPAGMGVQELFHTMQPSHRFLHKLKNAHEQMERMGNGAPISIEAARAAFLAGEATAAEEKLIREAIGPGGGGGEPPTDPASAKSQAAMKRRKSSARFFVWGECVVDMKEHEDEAADDVFMSDLAIDSGKKKPAKHNKKRRLSVSFQDEVEPTPVLDEQGVFHYGDFAVDTTTDSWTDYSSYGGGGGGASAMDFAFGDFAIGVDEETLKKHEPQRYAKKNKLALDVPKKEPKPEGLTIVNYLIHYLVGHAVRVKCVAISPDEKHILSCSHEDVLVVLSDINTGKEMVSFSGHDDTLTSVAFSQDQKHVATTSRDQNLILWDAITAKVLLQFEHDKVVICCAWSKSGRLIVSGCQDKVCRVWDTKKGKERAAFTEHVAIIISLDFAPDDKHVVSASADKTVRIWSASNGQSVRVLKGHSGIVLGCRYLKDGKQILSNDENEIKLWDVKTGACKLSMHVENIQMALPIARSTKKRYTWTLCSACPGDFSNYIIASCNLRTVIIFDRSTGEEVLTVYTRAPVYCLASSVHDKIVLGDSVGNIYVITLQGI